jgi:alpha/beta superfamily hydrolase
MRAADGRIVDEQVILHTSDGGTTRGRLAVQEAGRYAAAVLHPHPQQGGNSSNAFVVASVNALHAMGASTLRFDFRKPAQDLLAASTRDLQAALATLCERTPAAQALVLVGYSYGSLVATRVACDESLTPAREISVLVLVAPPVGVLPSPSEMTTPLATWHRPLLHVVGDSDAYCPLEAFLRLPPQQAKREVVTNADHFLHGVCCRPR